jgi:ring-1,2-phenylacetyl-CoA epoxidase subunit PaaD
MVSADQVWAALDEIADPEIPVISLVELGVVRDVVVDGDRVHVSLTPTFLGCPALEAMQRALESKIADLGAEPEVEVVRGDAWSTDRITPAGREKLRAAGFAPPLPRSAWQRLNTRADKPRALSDGVPRAASAREASAPRLVQLQAKAFRCPYCGSTETRLENLFGPTPCRSIRYCDGCRQPFEQFKTI